MKSHLRKIGRVLGRWMPALLVALTACSPPPEKPVSPRLDRVVTTITPLGGLIRPLLPPQVACTPIIGPGEAVHGHQTTPGEIAQARSADVVFGVGLGIDSSALDAIGASPGRPIIVFADVVGLDTHVDHTHEPDGHCEHGAQTHLWLDPGLAAALVEHAGALLSDRAAGEGDASLAAEIRERTQAWIARIHGVDARYREALAPFKGRTILTTHSAFGLLLERYGLHERSFSPTSPHAAPSPAQLADALRFAASQQASAIFTEPQSPRGLAETVARRTGLPLGTLDPLGTGDWEAMMLANLDALVRALSSAPDSSEPAP